MEDELLTRIEELKTMVRANTRYTLGVSVALSELLAEVRKLGVVNEDEIPTLVDNPIPLVPTTKP